jgi:hypothetical protein
MVPNRINVKFFVEEPDAIDLPAFIPVFHRWIREDAIEGLPIDVADYAHVPDGPGILLIGHDGDYGIDRGDGRPGLLYSHKRDWPGDNLPERLHLVCQRALRAAQLLADEPELNGFVIRTDEMELSFPDRLRTPNRPETLAAVEADIQSVLQAWFGGDVNLALASKDERRPFTLHITVPDAPDVTSLLSRVEPVVA